MANVALRNDYSCVGAWPTVPAWMRMVLTSSVGLGLTELSIDRDGSYILEKCAN